MEKLQCIQCGDHFDPFEAPTQPYCAACYEENHPSINCRGKRCSKSIKYYDRDQWRRYDFHGIFTGYYCAECFQNNYPYKRGDYTHGTGIADDGTPINPLD